MNNEYEMTLDWEVVADQMEMQAEFLRECEELDTLDKMDAGYDDE